MMLSHMVRVRVRVINQSNKSAGCESEVYTDFYHRSGDAFVRRRCPMIDKIIPDGLCGRAGRTRA